MLGAMIKVSADFVLRMHRGAIRPWPPLTVLGVMESMKNHG